MKGINIKEFYESLEHGHELEFEYNGNEYVIQPIGEDNRYWLVAYLCGDKEEGKQYEFSFMKELSHQYVFAVPVAKIG